MSSTISTLYGSAIYDSSLYDAPEGEIIASGSTNFVLQAGVIKSNTFTANATSNFNASFQFIFSINLNCNALSSLNIAGFNILNTSLNIAAVGSWGLAFARLNKNANVLISSNSDFNLNVTIVKIVSFSNIYAFIQSFVNLDIANVNANIDRTKYGEINLNSSLDYVLNGSLFFELITDEIFADSSIYIDPYLIDVNCFIYLENDAIIYEENVYEEIISDGFIYQEDTGTQPDDLVATTVIIKVPVTTFYTGSDGKTYSVTTYVDTPTIVYVPFAESTITTFAIFQYADAFIKKIHEKDILADTHILTTRESNILIDTIIKDENSFKDLTSYGVIQHQNLMFDLYSDAFVGYNSEEKTNQLLSTSIISELNENKDMIADGEIYDGNLSIPQISIYGNAYIDYSKYEIVSDSYIIDLWNLMFGSSPNLCLMFGDAVIQKEYIVTVSAQAIIVQFFTADTTQPPKTTQTLNIEMSAIITGGLQTIPLIKANISYFIASYYSGQMYLITDDSATAINLYKFIRATAYIYQKNYEIVGDARIAVDSVSELTIASDASVFAESIIIFSPKANIAGYKGEPKQITADAFIGYRVFPVPAKERIV